MVCVRVIVAAMSAVIREAGTAYIHFSTVLILCSRSLMCWLFSMVK